MNIQESKKLETKGIKILKGYIKKNTPVVLALSGGPDSVFLYHLLSKLQKEIPFKLIAAHVNHMIRGKESDLDSEFLKKLVKKNLNIKKLDIPFLSKKLKTGLEETGRKVRYKFFEELAKKHKAGHIVTAHHADDNLETIILNLARGASIKGLIGMKEKEKKLLRPLLSFSKKEILDYLKFNKLKFRTDKTNKDTLFKRNFIREKIIAPLKNINPNLIKTIAKNSENLKEIDKFLETEALKWIKENALDKSFKKFKAKPFRILPKALQKRVLLEIHKKHGKSLADIESKHLEEVINMIEKNIGNKKKKLKSLTISIRNNVISLNLVLKKITKK